MFKSRLYKYFILFQHLYVIPICFFVGRHGIMVDGFRNERLLREWAGLACHFAWVAGLCSFSSHPFLTYFVATCFQGLLSVQLICNHNIKSFKEENVAIEQSSFVERQVESNINLTCPPHLDWFFGGLHFHHEHHLFPKMSREHLRTVSKDVERFCGENRLDYDKSTLLECVWRIVVHFKKIGRAYYEYSCQKEMIQDGKVMPTAKRG
mmetsp:Transcript_9518/g.23901  ORF Transcript_9518/g.23901 Transcript_9518/m.23901 type:complete len:208 (-) Transcript_9518:266-889(-)